MTIKDEMNPVGMRSIRSKMLIDFWEKHHNGND
jgi:hypothetical protein